MGNNDEKTQPDIEPPYGPHTAEQARRARALTDAVLAIELQPARRT